MVIFLISYTYYILKAEPLKFLPHIYFTNSLDRFEDGRETCENEAFLVLFRGRVQNIAQCFCL